MIFFADEPSDDQAPASTPTPAAAPPAADAAPAAPPAPVGALPTEAPAPAGASGLFAGGSTERAAAAAPVAAAPVPAAPVAAAPVAAPVAAALAAAAAGAISEAFPAPTPIAPPAAPAAPARLSPVSAPAPGVRPASANGAAPETEPAIAAPPPAAPMPPVAPSPPVAPIPPAAPTPLAPPKPPAAPTPTVGFAPPPARPAPIPVEPAPVETPPVEPAPVATSPVEPAPVETAPVGPETAPVAAPEETPADAPAANGAAALPVHPGEEPLPTGSGAVIKVIGVGGGGGNAVNRMIEAGVRGVEFIAANTDLQVLERSLAPVKIPLGVDRTGGLGCGGDPEIGRAAARDDMDTLISALRGADMVFLTVGEGGGTGTGAAPVVACVAQEIQALGVAVATRPLAVEGRRRRETADDGIRELREYVDTLISVPNDRVVEVFGDQPIRSAFREADDVVRQAVQGISDLIQTPGEINLDFADVRTAMRARGDAVMGIGVASGEHRVEEATRAAISSPLLEDTSIRGASSIILNVSGGDSLTLNEVQRAAEVVRDAVLPDGPALRAAAASEPGDYILLGTALDPSLDEAESGPAIRVTVVATGFPERSRAGATPQDFFAYTRRAVADPAAVGAPSGAPSGIPSGIPSGPNGHAPASEGAGAAAERTNGAPVEPRAPVAFPTPARAAGGRPNGGDRPRPAERPYPPEEASPPTPTPDAPPTFDAAAAGDERWGDLDTPAWSQHPNNR